MRKILTLFILFLIAGSITALGYSLYQAGIIGTKAASLSQNAQPQATTSTSETQQNKKDLSWMQQIKGISENDQANNDPASSTNPDDQTTTTTSYLVATSTAPTDTTNDISTSSTTSTDSESGQQAQTIHDLGKGDALTSTVYDYAFSSLVLTAEIRHGTVFLTWTPATSNTFTSYKVIRSTTDENPYLPKTTALKTLTDVTQTAYTDAKVFSGSSYYYRVCMTKQGKPPACGNTVEVSL